jgi:acyl dehydratase
MAIDYEKLKNWVVPEVHSDYGDEDAILYALGVGLGSDPTDFDQLRFVYEEQLKALPTMALTLGYPGFWLKDPDTGVNWQKVLHGEQSIEFHAPLKPSGHIVGKTWVDEIVDKGAGKGALIYQRRTLTDRQTGKLICTLASTTFCRGDGGFGGPPGPTTVPHELESRTPDSVCDLPTLPQSALLYRLNGDFNPLHADPRVARNAGFERPILHGLCTFGIAGHALLKTLCGYESGMVRKMTARFSSPVYPGETVRTEIWREGSRKAGFRCRVVERDVIVLNNGAFEYVGDGP